MKEIPEILHIKTTPAEAWIGSLKKEGNLREEIAYSKFFEEKFRLLTTSKDFLLRIGELRTKFGIYYQEFSDINKCLIWAENLYINKSKKGEFEREIDKCLNDFRMSQRWRPVLESFLIFNVIADYLFPPPFDIEVTPNGDKFILKIEIYRSTTEKDIKNNWKIIKKHQTLLKPLRDDTPLDKDNLTFSLDPKTKKPIILPNYSMGRKRSSTSERILKVQKLKKQKYKNKDIAREIGLSELDSYTVNAYDNRYRKRLEGVEFY